MSTFCKISKEVEFDAGHRVPSHSGKCRNPHGHRYKVRVTCDGQIIDAPGQPDHGMLVDFTDLKLLTTRLIHDVLDHTMVIWEDDKVLLSALDGNGWHVVPFPYIPTAENLARWTWEQLQPALSTRFGDTLKLAEIAVWETPTSVAYFTGGAA